MNALGRLLGSSAMLLAGCAGALPPHGTRQPQPATARSGERALPTPEQVLGWANLDMNLGRHPEKLDHGLADGRSILGDKVMVLNGEDMVRFVRAHGYVAHKGIVASQRTGSIMTIHVLVVGKDGTEMILQLESDGETQGQG